MKLEISKYASNAKDLSGKAFGQLTVLDFAGRNKSRHLLWNCRCKCGNEITIPSGRLARQHTCGCLKRPNLKGKRFSNLVVQSEAGNTRKSGNRLNRLWLCKCDCGNEKTACTSDLNSGVIKSCGCIVGNPNDLRNHRFGRLVAKKKLDKRSKNRYTIWLCECDCSKTVNVSSNQLLNGKVKSCGCLLESGPQNCRWKGIGSLSLKKFGRIRKSANRRSIEFKLSIEEAWDIFNSQNGLCKLSGVPIDLIQNTASLDRIDSNKGYSKDNVQWVHKIINIMKWSLPQDEFIKWCNKVIAHSAKR